MSEKHTHPGGPSEDTLRLLSQVVLACGAIVLFVLFAWIVLPGVRREAAEPKARPGAQEPTAPSAGWLDSAEAPARAAEEIPPVDPKEVLEPTPALLERGKALYGQNCVSCHGPAGMGDGAAAGALNPKPRNLSAAAGWKNGPTRTGVYKTLAAGIPGTGMVAYDFLTPKDRMALVHYVRGLGSFDHGADDPAALEALSASFASKGGKVPARIPVTRAMERLAAEDGAVAPIAPPPPGDDSPGARALRRAVADGARAARFLGGVPAWRTDAGALARAACAGAPHNGFNAAVATFTAEEWKALQAALAAAGAP